jgi:hypothetical protein
MRIGCSARIFQFPQAHSGTLSHQPDDESPSQRLPDLSLCCPSLLCLIIVITILGHPAVAVAAASQTAAAYAVRCVHGQAEMSAAYDGLAAADAVSNALLGGAADAHC